MTKHRIVVAAGLLAVVGCASSSDDRRHETVTRSGGVTETSSRDPGLARDRATRRGERMVYEDRVPSTATEITQRTALTDGPRRNDAVLVGRAPSNGEVWVVEADTGRIIYGGHLLGGQQLIVNLSRNELSMDARPLSAVRVDGAKAYKIYFLAG
jgi:hypothetical protein